MNVTAFSTAIGMMLDLIDALPALRIRIERNRLRRDRMNRVFRRL